MMTETDTGSATRDLGVSEGVAWTYADGKAQILSGKQAARLVAEAKGFDEDEWHLTVSPRRPARKHDH